MQRRKENIPGRGISVSKGQGAETQVGRAYGQPGKQVHLVRKKSALIFTTHTALICPFVLLFFIFMSVHLIS